MQPLLRIENLTVEYCAAGKDSVRALHQIHLQLNPREAIGILGESGSGKSTLAQSILGLLPPNARIPCGSIRFRGRELVDLPEQEIRKIRGSEIALIPQEPASALHPVLSVSTLVTDVIAAHSTATRRKCREAARRALQEAGLRDVERMVSAYPHQLSGGERQRVAIAQALACRPSLLIADEPTSSLDSTVQAKILHLLRHLQSESGMAVIFVSHNPAVLEEVAERIIVMYAGEIVEDGAARQVLSSPMHPYTVALSRCLPQRNPRGIPLGIIGGESPELSQPPPGCGFESRCPDRLAVCACRIPPEVQLPGASRVRCFKYGG
jgi:oligopeptide/dipeptide ABC transporter ATP-binding protein